MLFYKCYETFKLTLVVTDAFIWLLKMIECTIHTVLKTVNRIWNELKDVWEKTIPIYDGFCILLLNTWDCEEDSIHLILEVAFWGSLYTIVDRYTQLTLAVIHTWQMVHSNETHLLSTGSKINDLKVCYNMYNKMSWLSFIARVEIPAKH